MIERRQPLDAEHFPGWSGFGVTVAMDQQNPVAKTPGQSGFVQHHGHARATIARYAGKQFEHGNLVLQVKVGNRLIKQKQLWRLGEQRGNGQSLTFAAGEGQYITLFERGQIDSRQGFTDNFRVLVGFPAPAVEVGMTADHCRFQNR